MTLENTATISAVVPTIVSDNEKLFPEVLNLVRATPGGVPGLLKMFQDKGLGHVAAALISRDGTRMISPQQIVQGLGMRRIEALATASRLETKIVRKELVMVLPHVLEQLAPATNAAKGADERYPR
jgi:uncharacterized protein YidB (DUF937 family)